MTKHDTKPDYERLTRILRAYHGLEFDDSKWKDSVRLSAIQRGMPAITRLS